MGRTRTIDKDDLLDAAERVVLRDGAINLTIEAVANEAGVSKGGVLYAFPTKDTLIDTMVARVFASLDEVADAVIAEVGDGPEGRIHGHVAASKSAAGKMNERSIALLVNCMRSPEYRVSASNYYRSVFDELDTTTPKGKKLRLALLACEGALLLHGYGFHSFESQEWTELHEDIASLLLD